MIYCHVSAQEREHAHREGLRDERDAFVDAQSLDLLHSGTCTPVDDVIDYTDLAEELANHDHYELAVKQAARGDYALLDDLLRQIAHDLVEQEVPYVE